MYTKDPAIFDKIIEVEDNNENPKRYYDGSPHTSVYILKMQEELIVWIPSPMKTQWLWTRFVVPNDKLLNAFNHIDFQIYQKVVDLCLGDVILNLHILMIQA